MYKLTCRILTTTITLLGLSFLIFPSQTLQLCFHFTSPPPSTAISPIGFKNGYWSKNSSFPSQFHSTKNDPFILGVQEEYFLPIDTRALLSSTSSPSSPSLLDILLIRLIGCALLPWGILSITLLFGFSNKDDNGSQMNNEGSGANSTTNTATNHRIVLVSQSFFGLLLVLIGLVLRIDDNDWQSMEMIQILSFGSILLVLPCLCLMNSYWNTSTTIAANTSSTVVASSRRIDTDEEEYSGEYMLLEQDQDTTNTSTNSSTPNFSTRITGIRRLLKLAGPQSFYLFIGCIVLLIRLPFSLSIPHFVSTTLGALSHGNYHQAKVNIGLLCLLGTIDAALDFWCVFLFGLANLKIVRGVRLDTFQAILRQDVAYFDSMSSGDLTSRLNSDCGEMGGDLTWFFRFSIESTVRVTGIVTYMLIRSPRLGACAIAVVPIIAVINKKYGDFLHQNAKEVQTALAQANSVSQETLSCARTVITFTTEHLEYNKYNEKINRHYDLNVKQLYAQGLYYMLISTFLINTCVQALLLYIGTVMIQHEELEAEVLLAFMLYQSQLQNEVLNLFNSFTSLIKSSGAGDKVFELLDRITPAPGTGSTNVISHEDDSDQSESNSSTISAEQATTSHSTSISLRDVHFSYPNRLDQPVLKGINIEIPAGKTIALVGASGCGKSTILGLIQRLYDPTQGDIRVDGNQLRNMNLMTFRRNVGVVTQDPVLFSGSINSNIGYGNPDISFQAIQKAAQLANAHNFIEQFPDKYETEVGERGIQLSGGQKQRLAIARAIAKAPSLLLLDEATSSLDSEAEKVVQEALDNMIHANESITTVIIAHRLQTVQNADKIIVISDGRVVQEGSHCELMEVDGIYHKMIKSSKL